MLLRANIIISTSQPYFDSSDILQKFKNKVTVIPIGVPKTNLEGSESHISKELSKSIQDKKIILSVGRLVNYKGFIFLIDAAKMLQRDSLVIIVGAGPLDYYLRNYINEIGVQDRVILAGRLSELALDFLYKESYIFCLPSINRAEAFGVVILEAMTYKLPIVTTTIPGSGASWVNSHRESGINVPVENSRAIADACNEILSSDIKRNKYSEGSLKRYQKEFSEELFVHRVVELYKKL